MSSAPKDGVRASLQHVPSNRRGSSHTLDPDQPHSNPWANLDLLAGVLENGPSLIVALDRHGRIALFNRRCEVLTGWRFEELRGELAWERLIPPEQVAEVQTVFGRMLNRRFADYHENEWLTRNGQRLLIAWSNTVLKNRNGEIEYVVGMGRDITEEAHTREALAVKTRHEAAILQSIEQGVYGIDEHGRITFVNQAATRMLGYSREALHGHSAHRLIHHSQADGTVYRVNACPTTAAMREGIVTRQEEVLWRQDGSALPVWFVSSPVFDEGVVVGSVVSFEDLTERKHLEARLEAHKERFRITLESIADAVLATNTSGRITYLNPAAERLTGWSEAEALSKPSCQVLSLHHQDGRTGSDPVALCLERNAAVHLDEDGLVVCKRNGVKVSISASAAPLSGPGDKPTGVVLVIHDGTEKQRLATHIDWQGRHDTLTELFNRAEFERRLAAAADCAADNGTEHVLLFIDLNQFKLVNDTSGHLAGDELLRRIALLLCEHTRRHDTVARLGGDEFAVLLNECPREKALEIAEDLRAALANHPFTWQERTFAVRASIGLASVRDEIGDVRAIMRRAERALSAAKEAGSNQLYASWEHTDDLTARQGEMTPSSRILDALAEKRFVLYCQHIMALNADTTAQAHCEILIRMLAPDGQLVPPNEFIPAAERYGLMPAIDQWVVAQVLDWLAASPPEAMPATFFINLSGQSLSDPDFALFLGEKFRAFPEAAHHLCFEITETAAIKNFHHTIQIMAALNPLGCRFALDDFGSGLSSFGYLRKLPVDILKIDGSFIKRMSKDRVDYAMVRAISEVARTLELETVGEFVEDEKTLECLRELGISFAQGYALGKPVPFEGFIAAHLS